MGDSFLKSNELFFCGQKNLQKNSPLMEKLQKATSFC